MSLSESQIADRLRQNLSEVRGKIAAAASQAGRSADSVMLVGVTKYVEPPIARMLAEAGLENLGESRPQELWRKFEALAEICVGSPLTADITKSKQGFVHWHLIGHLQRNKVRRTLPMTALVQSADNLRLLEEISREAHSNRWPADVLLEVNVSGDVAKHGFRPEEVEPLIPQLLKLNSVFVLGLMTMASLDGGKDRARRDFASLRELSETVKANCSGNIVMNELSMGMSGDYEVAIEEGATIVRVGSALFEGIEA